MAHQCRDCSYTGKRISQGSCPACGSANFGRIGGELEEPERKSSPLTTLTMLCLWSVLGYLLYSKLW